MCDPQPVAHATDTRSPRPQMGARSSTHLTNGGEADEAAEEGGTSGSEVLSLSLLSLINPNLPRQPFAALFNKGFHLLRLPFSRLKNGPDPISPPYPPPTPARVAALVLLAPDRKWGRGRRNVIPPKRDSICLKTKALSLQPNVLSYDGRFLFKAVSSFFFFFSLR